MAKFSYYNDKHEYKTKEVDKDKKLPQLMITVWSGDLNNRDENGNLERVNFEWFKPKTLQEADDIFTEQFKKYDAKAFDIKLHSHGCLKMYWEDEQGREILTYIRLEYRGNEVTSYDLG